MKAKRLAGLPSTESFFNMPVATLVLLAFMCSVTLAGTPGVVWDNGFDGPFDAIGAGLSNQFESFTPPGFDVIGILAGDFILPAGTMITGAKQRFFIPSEGGALEGVVVTFWGDDGGQPSNTITDQFIIQNSAIQSSDAMGDYLEVGFPANGSHVATGNVEWVSITPVQGFPPQIFTNIVVQQFGSYRGWSAFHPADPANPWNNTTNFDPQTDVNFALLGFDMDCGDGVIQAGEDCDDAGESAFCDIDCTFVLCGDGYHNVTAGEVCDDGGNTPFCDSDCTLPECGDGLTNQLAGEECDDGMDNGQPMSNCRANCTLRVCGDGIVNDGEECDDGGETPSCDVDCTFSGCGDGVVNASAGEQCDDAGPSDTCTDLCTFIPIDMFCIEFTEDSFGATGNVASRSDVNDTGETPLRTADRFQFFNTKQIIELRWLGYFRMLEGGVFSDCNVIPPDNFTIRILGDNGGLPDDNNVIFSITQAGNPGAFSVMDSPLVNTPIGFRPVREHTLTFNPPLLIDTIDPLYVEIVNDTAPGTCFWWFRTGPPGDGISWTDDFTGWDAGDENDFDFAYCFTTTETICGNGVVDVDEKCDDGGESASCDADCTIVICGDMAINATAGEECDDGAGNADVADACRTDCTLPTCGDAIVDTVEQCDDGVFNADVADACRTNCQSPICGDGIVDFDEACDESGQAESCDDDCTLPECGDGNVNQAAGETCDDGGASAACDIDCTLAECGDGSLNLLAGEICDDGNNDDGDGCAANCGLEPAAPVPAITSSGMTVLLMMFGVMLVWRFRRFEIVG